MVFYNNDPWGHTRPCSGVFVMQPGKTLPAMLKTWWDTDKPEKNFANYYEQDALWLMQNREQNPSQAAWVILNESAFYTHEWVSHLPPRSARRPKESFKRAIANAWCQRLSLRRNNSNHTAATPTVSFNLGCGPGYSPVRHDTSHLMNMGSQKLLWKYNNG